MDDKQKEPLRICYKPVLMLPAASKYKMCSYAEARDYILGRIAQNLGVPEHILKARSSYSHARSEGQ